MNPNESASTVTLGGGPTLCQVFWRTLHETTGIQPAVDDVSHQARARRKVQAETIIRSATAESVRSTMGQDALDLLCGKKHAEDHAAKLDALAQISSLTRFDQRLASRGKAADTVESASRFPNWSRDLEALSAVPPDHLTAHCIRSHFRHMRLCDAGVEYIDAELGKFDHLDELDVSGNRIKRLANLPDSLRVLNAYNNHGLDLDTSPHALDLQHLGVGCCQLGDLGPLAFCHTTLMSLDLSYNSLVDLNQTLACFERLEHLERLHLAGNPFCLIESYRSCVATQVSTLSTLDGLKLEEHEYIHDPTMLEQQQRVIAGWEMMMFEERVRKTNDMKRFGFINIEERNLDVAERAVMLIQKSWRSKQSVDLAKKKTSLMRENLCNRHVDVLIAVDAFEYVNVSEEPLDPKKAGKTGKGDKKGGASSASWKSNIQVYFPDSEPLQVKVGRSLEEADSPLLEHRIQLPINTRVRDKLRFSSVEIKLCETYDGGEGEQEQVAVVGKSKAKLAKLLDPFAIKQFRGKPRVSGDLLVDIDRSGTCLEEFCANPADSPDGELDPDGLPRQEQFRISIRVQLNPGPDSAKATSSD